VKTLLAVLVVQTSGIAIAADGGFPGCIDDDLTRAKEHGTKKRLKLETGCPVERIETKDLLCGTTTTFRLTACGHDYVCDVAASGTTCRKPLVE
jgi:hypothetical protein